MCAAPGSKTSQMLEALLRGASLKGEKEPSGFVIANDADTNRAYMLVRVCSSWCSKDTGLVSLGTRQRVLLLLPHLSADLTDQLCQFTEIMLVHLSLLPLFDHPCSCAKLSSIPVSAFRAGAPVQASKHRQPVCHDAPGPALPGAPGSPTRCVSHSVRQLDCQRSGHEYYCVQLAILTFSRVTHSSATNRRRSSCMCKAYRRAHSTKNNNV
jgi:hypothetical protein